MPKGRKQRQASSEGSSKTQSPREAGEETISPKTLTAPQDSSLLTPFGERSTLLHRLEKHTLKPDELCEILANESSSNGPFQGQQNRTQANLTNGDPDESELQRPDALLVKALQTLNLTLAAAHKSSYKLPAFNQHNIPRWLSTVTALFTRLNITDENSMYTELLAALPAEIASYIEPDKIATSTTPFTTATEILNHIFKKTRKELMNDLAAIPFNEEDKPSTFYRKLLSHTDNQISADVLKEHWLAALPELVRILASTIPEVHQMLHVADTAYATYKSHLPRATVCAAAQPPEHQTVSSLSHDHQPRWNTTTKYNTRKPRKYTPERQQPRQSRFYRQRPQTPGRRRTNQSISPSSDRSSSNERQGYCFYHYKFGEKAYNCAPPCTWRKSKNTDR